MNTSTQQKIFTPYWFSEALAQELHAYPTRLEHDNIN